MRKTPNALNTGEQGKDRREGEVWKEVRRDEGRDGGRREGGRKEGRERKGGGERPLSNLNNQCFALRAMLPIHYVCVLFILLYPDTLKELFISDLLLEELKLKSFEQV